MVFNPDEWLSKSRIVCGLMTGTSLDGIDAALVEFRRFQDGKNHFNLLNFVTIPYPTEIRQLILKIISEPVKISEISALNFILPELYSSAVNNVCNSAGLSKDKLDAVGMHGQTLWHEPYKIAVAGRFTVSTFQVGSVSVLAKLLNVPVVGDFRPADMALGGQGAPLVPIFDYDFLASKVEDIIALNIGGIANITYMKKCSSSQQVIAFDTGPGNVLINSAMKRFFNTDFDKNGESAKKGKIIPELITHLKNLSFISQKPPKSTGRELFNDTLFANFSTPETEQMKYDIIHTLAYFTAWSVSENIRLSANPESKIIASGGGVHNKFVIELLKQMLPGATIIKSDEAGIPADAKEAVCFAWLAFRTLGNLPGNLPGVTGAKRETVLGVIGLP